MAHEGRQIKDDDVIGAFGRAYLLWGEPAQALPLLQESAELFAPFAQQAPGVFDIKYDRVRELYLMAYFMQDY